MVGGGVGGGWHASEDFLVVGSGAPLPGGGGEWRWWQQGEGWCAGGVAASCTDGCSIPSPPVLSPPSPQVRAYWNVKGAVGAAAWHRLMRAYYAASQLGQAQVRLPPGARLQAARARQAVGAGATACGCTHASVGRACVMVTCSLAHPLAVQALALRWQHGPPAVAGEIFHRPPAAVERAEEGEVEAGGGAAEPELAAEEGAAALGAAPAAQVCVPPVRFWSW